MEKIFNQLMQGYELFRKKYASGDHSVMQYLSDYGQRPEIMVISCCDSRVDPALILQCDPGVLFVVRNVANIVPPYEKDEAHHGTSAALEFGIRGLGIKHLILLGHSQCGGIQALVNNTDDNDFISNWVSLIKKPRNIDDADECAKYALTDSYQNCLTFPWIEEKVRQKALAIHLWYFDIKQGQIYAYSEKDKAYHPLNQPA